MKKSELKEAIQKILKEDNKNFYKYTYEDMDELRRKAISFGATESLNNWFKENIKR